MEGSNYALWGHGRVARDAFEFQRLRSLLFRSLDIFLPDTFRREFSARKGIFARRRSTERRGLSLD